MVKKTDSETEYKYDVFISYSSKDKEWVRGELLTRIEKTGLTAFIDFRDFTRGAPSIKECERGVVECKKTLLILTPEYIESEWCEFENIMGQTLSPANRDLRIIPLLKTRCEKPLRIGALTYIDFTDGADLDLAWLQLLTALGKPPEPKPQKEPERGDWFLAHPYPMPPNFTGRVSEREMLTGWLDADDTHPLLSLRALGGFGKSALVWHWLMHDVKPTDWPRVVWWSFYESDAGFNNFLTKTLDYLSGGEITVTNPSANEIETLVGMLHQPDTLLVLDGFERELRAFGGLSAAYKGDGEEPKESDHDCISPLAETFLRNVATLPNIRSKILLTTRLSPRALEARGGGLLQGCREEELIQMQPDDAVEYFRARGIRGMDAEIKQACEPYGYHPLSLCLLTGLIMGDLQQPGDIAVANRLDVSGDLVARQTHVLEITYDSLTLERRALLSRIACFRSPTEYDALKKLAESAAESVVTVDTDLHDLVARGLLHHDPKENRFDLHPIVRRYAYDRLATPDRNAAHTKLRDYFAAVPTPDEPTCLEDLAPVIELYHHTVNAGQFDEALDLFHDRIANPLHFQFAVYQLCVDLLGALFLDGEGQPPRLKDENAQGWTLNELATSYSFSGQPNSAVPLFQQALAICEKLDDKRNLAVGLEAGASAALFPTGALRSAEDNMHRSVALCREIGDEPNEGIGHRDLGQLLTYRGVYAESDTELRASTAQSKISKHLQAQCLDESTRALCHLLHLRSEPDSAHCSPQSALESAHRAFELAEKYARTDCPIERDYVRAHWLLGAAHRVAGQPDEAERHLYEALERCRKINLVDTEADILIDLARLRASTDKPNEALQYAKDALLITKRSGYVLQGADAHLELAKLALASGDKATALDHAQQAKTLATCDGPPDYTYHAAYTEAEALLKKLSS